MRPCHVRLIAQHGASYGFRISQTRRPQGSPRRVSLRNTAEEDVDIPETKNSTANHLVTGKILSSKGGWIDPSAGSPRSSAHPTLHQLLLSHIERRIGKMYPPHILRLVMELVLGHPSGATSYWWTCRPSQSARRFRQLIKSHMVMIALSEPHPRSARPQKL
jgi:hypothetical protein